MMGGAGGGWAGATIQGVTQALDSALSAHKASIEAKKARKWQEHMFRHRYQFTMEDMRAAGLNPILAARGGLTGSSPSGAMAGPGKSGGGAGLGQAVTSGLRLKAEMAALKAQTFAAEQAGTASAMAAQKSAEEARTTRDSRPLLLEQMNQQNKIRNPDVMSADQLEEILETEAGATARKAQGWAEMLRRIFGGK